ncbi:hypothetical protein LTSEALA_0905, partial [Salmonella enterica subsp. enterica serovar Alachua str. R6-377]
LPVNDNGAGMDFAARDPARAGEYIALGFEAMWRALTREEQ